MVAAGEFFGGCEINAGIAAEFGGGFLLAVIQPINLGPFRPGIVCGAVHGRTRQDFQLHQAFAAVAQRGADAVRSRVAAADDDNVLARGGNGGAVGVAVEPVFGVALQKLHGEMDALQVPAFDGQIARLGCAGAKDDGVKFPQEVLRRIIRPDLGVGNEMDAFLRHLIDAALDQFLVQFHVGNAVHEQAAEAIGALEDGDQMAGAIELGGGTEARRTGADDRHFFAGAGGGPFRLDPAFLPALVSDGAFDVFNGDGREVMPRTQEPSQGAGQTRPVKSGKLLVLWRRSSASRHRPR